MLVKPASGWSLGVYGIKDEEISSIGLSLPVVSSLCDSTLAMPFALASVLTVNISPSQKIEVLLTVNEILFPLSCPFSCNPIFVYWYNGLDSSTILNIPLYKFKLPKKSCNSGTLLGVRNSSRFCTTVKMWLIPSSDTRCPKDSTS